MSIRIGGASSSPATACTGFPKRYAFASLNASKLATCTCQQPNDLFLFEMLSDVSECLSWLEFG
jgi:hypothetical protein